MDKFTNTPLNKQKTFTLFGLLFFISLTRGHVNWLDSIVHLPDFTLPALFIAGVYLRNWLIPFIIIGFALLIDWYVVSNSNVDFLNHFCITSAYFYLIPAYLMMYLGGQFLTSFKINSVKNLIQIFFVLTIAWVAEWLISSISFYLLSPYFPQPSLGEFINRIEQYATGSILNLLKWMLVVVLLFNVKIDFIMNKIKTNQAHKA